MNNEEILFLERNVKHRFYDNIKGLTVQESKNTLNSYKNKLFGLLSDNNKSESQKEIYSYTLIFLEDIIDSIDN